MTVVPETTTPNLGGLLTIDLSQLPATFSTWLPPPPPSELEAAIRAKKDERGALRQGRRTQDRRLWEAIDGIHSRVERLEGCEADLASRAQRRVQELVADTEAPSSADFARVTAELRLLQDRQRFPYLYTQFPHIDLPAVLALSQLLPETGEWVPACTLFNPGKDTSSLDLHAEVDEEGLLIPQSICIRSKPKRVAQLWRPPQDQLTRLLTSKVADTDWWASRRIRERSFAVQFAGGFPDHVRQGLQGWRTQFDRVFMLYAFPPWAKARTPIDIKDPWMIGEMEVKVRRQAPRLRHFLLTPDGFDLQPFEELFAPHINLAKPTA